MTNMTISLDPGCCRDNFLLFGSRQGQLCWYIWAGIVTISSVISEAGGHISSVLIMHTKCQAQFHQDADLYLVCEHFPWESWYRLPLLTHLLTYTLIYLLSYVHTYLHIYLHPYLHTYVLIYLHTYLLIYILTYLITYLHTYLLTYIHTYIHTYILI